MKLLEWRLAGAAAILLATTPSLVVSQQTPEDAGIPLTLEQATEPDEDMLVRAIQTVATQTEQFVELADQIAAVELVEVDGIADGAVVEQALADAETDLSLLRAALTGSEPVSEALQGEGVAADDVVAATVIQGDVVSLVLYHRPS